MQKALRIVVAGAGGMGALFGSILKEGGHSVTLFDRDTKHIDTIRLKGLRIEGFGGERTVALEATTDASDIRSADVVIFQCKAHGTRKAAQAVAHLVREGAVCLSFQNGLGNEEIIGAEVGLENVLGGLTTMAAVKLAPGVVRDFSRVPSYIGEMNGASSARAERLAEQFSEAGLPTLAKADIQTEIWKKLMGNISMSALSGITGLTAASCMSLSSLKKVCLQAADEALAVARSQGINLNREEVVHGMELISTPGGTGDNKSSLAVDLENRRPTEVDVLYGFVIQRGQSTGIETPTLCTLSAIVKGLESQYLSESKS